MRSKIFFQKLVMVALLAGVFQVNQQNAAFTMTTPPTTGAAIYDTRTIVPKDHPLEILASQANSFLSLAAEYKTLTYVYPGDAALNATKLQADILNRFGNILYLSEEAVPNRIKALLENSFNNVIKAENDLLNRKVDVLLTESKTNINNFLKSIEKKTMEEQNKALTATIQTLREVSKSEIVTSDKLLKIVKKFEDFKKAIDNSFDAAGAFNKTIADKVKFAQFNLNQTETQIRNSLFITTKTHISSLGKARASIQKNVARENVGGAAAWANQATAYFQPINDCPVDGKILMQNAKNLLETSQAGLKTGLDGLLNPKKTILDNINTNLNTLAVSANVTDAICTNLRWFVSPRVGPTAPPAVNITLRAVISRLENLIYTTTQVKSIYQAAAVTAHNANLNTLLTTSLPIEYNAIQQLEVIRGFDLFQYERMKELVSDIIAKSIALRTVLPDRIFAALTPFFTCTAARCELPNNYDFGLTTVDQIKAFIQIFKNAVAPELSPFETARLLDVAEADLTREVGAASAVLIQTIYQTKIPAMATEALNYTNEYTRPFVDEVKMIEAELILFESQKNAPSAYTFITDSFSRILGKVRKDVEGIATLKTQLVSTEHAIKVASLSANQVLPGIDLFKAQLKGKGKATVAAIAALPCITVTPVANLVAPSLSVIYRSFVVQFNETNCFLVSNALLKETADAESTFYLCPVDIRSAQYAAVPKVLFSTVKAPSPTVPPTNGVTSLPTANPLLVNESTNNVADGTVAGKTYLRMNEVTGPAFKEYTACILSLSKSLAIVKLTLPVLSLLTPPNPLNENPLKDLSQIQAYRQFYFNVTTTAA